MKYLVLIIAMIFCANLHAQDFKIEKITEKDFTNFSYPKDTTASAVVDYRIGKTYFEIAGENYQLVTITKTRVRILKKEGYDYATIKVPLYREQSSKETIDVSNAFTYNLINGQVEKTKLNSSGEFTERLEGNHYLTTFTMPNVKEGSIIEYTTKFVSPFFTYIPEFRFQFDIPVVYGEFSIRIPEFLHFYKYIKGSAGISQTKVGDEVFYKAHHIPALKDEGFVNNINNYRASILHTFSGYTDNNKSQQMVAGTWEDVVKSIYDHENFGQQLKKVDFLKEVSISLIKGFENNEDKSNAIFEYVKNNYSSNNKRGIYATQSLRETFKNKSGSIADINLLAVAMMKSVNIPAYPILLATRSKGIAYMPSPNAFNSVIIGVEFGTRTILYDASDKLSSKDILPIENLNWIGRLVRDNGTSKDVLIEPKLKSRYGLMSTVKINSLEGSISGSVRKNLSNYEALQYRHSKSKDVESKIIEKIESDYAIEVEDYQVKNMADISLNIEESFKMTREAAFDRIADKIYIAPLNIFTFRNNPFKAETRNYPIDFVYPNDNSYTITYEIPEGYQVDYLPESKKYSTANNSFSARWVVGKDDKHVQIKFNIDFRTAFVEAKDYVDIKFIYDEVLKFMNEKIVFKKK